MMTDEKKLTIVGKAAEIRKGNFQVLHEKTGFDRKSLIFAVNMTYGSPPDAQKYFLVVIDKGGDEVVSTFSAYESYLSRNFYFDILDVDEDGWFDLKVDDMTEFLRIYGEGEEH